jgi:hypothetical protein
MGSKQWVKFKRQLRQPYTQCIELPANTKVQC